MSRLAGQTVLVTGAASGIGAAIAEVAAREGGAVALLDLTDPARSAKDLAERYGVRTTAVELDITGPELDHAIARVAAELGPVTVLVNNAGRNARFEPGTLTEQQWDDAFALLLKAAWRTTHAVLPGMIAAGGGSIVNIASIHARLTAERFFPYAAAKAGVVGMTRSMAVDLGRYGVRVNAISPGYIRTPPVEQFFAENPGVEDEVLANHPLGRIGTPADVAEVVCFLASPAAANVSGAEWPVDGGHSARFSGPG